MPYIQVKTAADNRIIAPRVYRADRFLTRMKGLLGKKELPEGEGLLLYPCSSIHCIGMKFAIDAVFLDPELYIIDLRENLKPGAAAGKRGARSVLELPAGQVKKQGLKTGMRLVFSEYKE